MPGTFDRSPTGRRAGAACLLLASLGAGSLVADDVHLVNGRVFEDVIATVGEQHVVIELEAGTMTLPRSQVARVVDQASPLEIFRDRRRSLAADPSSSAARWAELATWAWAHGLERDATATALLAARLDSAVEGIDSLLVSGGLERDPELGWVPRAVAMERRGLVSHRGEWMTPARRDERIVWERAEAAAAAERAASRREPDPVESDADRPGAGDNDVALASIELARQALEARLGEPLGTTAGLVRSGTFFVPLLPLSGGGGFWHGGRPPGNAPPPPSGDLAGHRARVAADWEALSNRIPGSRLPLSAFRDE